MKALRRLADRCSVRLHRRERRAIPRYFNVDDRGAAILLRGRRSLGTFCNINGFAYSEAGWPFVLLAHLRWSSEPGTSSFNCFHNRLVVDFEGRLVWIDRRSLLRTDDACEFHGPFERGTFAYRGDTDSGGIEIIGEPARSRTPILYETHHGHSCVLAVIAARLRHLRSFGPEPTIEPVQWRLSRTGDPVLPPDHSLISELRRRSSELCKRATSR
jgi:hypothetical protein